MGATFAFVDGEFLTDAEQRVGVRLNAFGLTDGDFKTAVTSILDAVEHDGVEIQFKGLQGSPPREGEPLA